MTSPLCAAKGRALIDAQSVAGISFFTTRPSAAARSASLRLPLSFILIAACQSPTQLVVLIGTDFQVPSELAAIQTIITDDEGDDVGGEFFDLSRLGVPMSFGVEGGELADEQVRILVQGLTARDELLVDRTAVVGFIKGEK